MGARVLARAIVSAPSERGAGCGQARLGGRATSTRVAGSRLATTTWRAAARHVALARVAPTAPREGVILLDRPTTKAGIEARSATGRVPVLHR